MIRTTLRMAKKLPGKVFRKLLFIKRHGLKLFLSENRHRFICPKYPCKGCVSRNSLLPKHMLHRDEPATRPLETFAVSAKTARINIVIDSLKKSSLFGGVATALILATLFAIRNKIPLRIIIRRDEGNLQPYFSLLKLMNLPRPEQVELFSDYDDYPRIMPFRLEVSDKDIFIATSWWSALAIKPASQRDKIFYLLQEVETYFYPHGDKRLICERILKDPNLVFVINSKLLMDYYKAEGFKNISDNGQYFEAAFPKHLYAPNENSFKPKKKHRFFFYARPGNPRNLFLTGLEILNRAFEEGILQLDEWDIYFGGSDNLPMFKFSIPVKVQHLGNMSWKDYIDFLPTVDLGLSLMYTPHPSYPPLDIAASGGVVLTNKYANKQSLDYSKNIVCADLEMPSMLAGFREAVALAKNPDQRKKNFESNLLSRDWERSFDAVLNKMAKECL